MNRSVWNTLCRIAFIISFISLALGPISSYAQSCNGLGPITGGVIALANGDFCANNATVPGKISITAGNVDDTDNPALVQFSIDWLDGTAAQIISNPATGWGGAGSHSYTAVVTHFFPVSGVNVKCTYKPVVTLIVNGTSCGSLGTPPTFIRWNTDNQAQGGVLNLSELATSVVNYQVCAGGVTNVTFKDRSVLNCLAAFSPTFPNQYTRSRQYIYGTGGSTITGVKIAGVAQAYPFSDVVLSTAATGVTSPPTPLNTSVITVPATATVGQFFEITMNEWDFCNPYPGTPITTTARITIIASPPAPTASPLTLCYAAATGAQNFTIGGTSGSTTLINWYNKNPTVAGFFKMTNPNGTNSTTFPLSGYTVANQGVSAPISTSQAGGAGAVYSVWATQVYGLTNVCESQPVEVVLIVAPQIPTPGAITGSTDFCVGASAVPFSLAAAAPSESIPINNFTNSAIVNFTSQYAWTFSNGNASVVAPSTTQSITANFTTAGSTTLQVLGQYTTAPTCNTSNSTLPITIDPTTVGGTVGVVGPICNGATTGSMALTGSVGSVLRWERNFNAGGFVTIAATAGLTSFSEVPPNGAGTYNYRAVLKSGACLTVNSTANTVIVNPVPSTPNITQTAGSTGLTICADGTQKTILQSDNTDGFAASYLWFKDGVSTGVTTSTITLTLTTQSGNYTVQKIGVATSNCPSLISSPVTVTINPLPTAGAPTGGGSVCSGNPAPDIVWTLTGTAPFNVTYTMTPGGPVSTTSPTNTFTIVAPQPAVNTTYQITTLTDANGCSGTSLGSSASVTIGGTAPTFVTGPTLTPTATCVNGGSTTDPQLVFTLDAGSASGVGFLLTYTVDGSSARTKTFNTNAASTATPAISFADAELNTTAGSPHTVKIVSIKSPANCQTIFNTSLSFTVNPLPAKPTGAVSNVACASAATGSVLKVNDPGATATIKWFSDAAGTTAAVGTTGGAHGEQFTPTSTATATYYAYTYSATGPTFCPSSTGTAVVETQDLQPATADAGPDQPSLCTTSATLAGVAPTNGGVGTWTVITGPATITSLNTFNSTVTGLTQNPPLGAPVSVTLRWTVVSALGACTTTSDDVILTVNPLPSKVDPAPHLCEDVLGSGTHVIADMNIYNAAVTNGTTVSWFKDIAHTQPLGASPAGPITINNSTQKIVYFLTTSAISCTNSGQITFTVDALPAANNQNLQFCEDFVGAAKKSGIDLTASQTAITGGAASRQVDWYEDAGLTTLISPGAAAGQTGNYTITATKTIFAKVTNTVSTETPKCFSVASVTLTLNLRPLDNPITGNTAVCADPTAISGVYQVDPLKNPGSNFTWTVSGVPAGSVQLFAGGGTNSSSFFVLLKFPVAGVVTITMFETLNGCVGNTKTLTVNVTDAPAANTVTGSTSVCTNQSGVVYSVATPNPSSTYTWTVSGDASIVGASSGTGLSFVPVNFGVVTPVNVTVKETSTSGCVGADASLVVNLSPNPAMTSASSAQVCSGDTPTLSFTSNLASTFSWKVTNITGAITGTAVGNTGSGDLSTTFNGAGALKNVSGAVGSVSFDVTPKATAAPNCQGATQSVVLTVNPEPVVASAQVKTICSNQAVSYEILLSPLNLPAGTVFSWAKPVMSDASNQGVAVAASSATVGVPNIADVLVNTSSSTITATYTIFAISGLGCSSTGAPKTVVITVNPQPVGASASAADICSDAPVNYNLQTQNINTLGNGVASTFSWKATSNAFVGGESITAQAGGIITDVLTNVTNADQTVVYAVTPTSSANSCAGTSFNVSVLVHPKPVGAVASAPAICSDASVAYNLQTQNINTVGNSVPSNFSWSAAANSNVSGQSTTSQSSVVITDVLVNVTNADQTVLYTVIPTSTANTCIGASFTVSVVVHPKPVGVTGNATAICSDAAVGYGLQVQNINALGNGVASNFSWSATSNTNVGGESTALQSTGTISDILTNVTSVDQTVVYNVVPSSSANSCVGTAFTISVVVHPKPVGVTTTAPAICSDANVAYNLQSQNVNTLGNSVASSFSWSAANNTNVGGESTAVQAGNVINDVLTNITSSDQTVLYTVTPTGSLNSCAGSPFTISVTVHPKPVGASASASPICSDGTVNYDLQGMNINTLGNSLASNFSWIATANGNVGGESSTAQAGSVITDVLQNVTNSDQTVLYTVSPSSSANGCAGAPFTISIIVHPKPVGVNVSAAPICSNGTVNYNLQIANINTLGNAVNSSFGWIATANASIGGESTTTQTSSTINDVLTNVTSTDQTVLYTVTPTSVANSCLGQPFTVSILVHPKPVGVTGSAPAICSDAAVGYNLQTQNVNTVGNSVNSTFTWIATANSNVGGESTTSQSGAILTDVLTNVTNVDQTVLYAVTPVSVADLCAGSAFTISVIVHPKPVGVTAAAAPICSDASVNYDLQVQNINTLGNSLATSFSWIATANGNVGGESTTAQATSVINDVLTNVTNADQTVSYTVTPSSTANGCLGANFTISILVHPKPVGVSAAASPICSNAAVGYALQAQNISALGNGVNSSFTWVATPNANVTGLSTSIQSTGTISDVLVNVTASDQTVNYTVVPTSTSNSCTGQSFNISVLVHPKPVGVTTAAPAICSDASVAYNLQTQNVDVLGNAVPANFSWIATLNSNVSGESTTIQSGPILTDALVNVTNGDQTVLYTVTPTSIANSCVGTSFTVSVLVHPKPLGVAASAPAICSDASVNYNLQTQNINALGNSLASAFSWIAATNSNVSGESTTTQTGNLITDNLGNITSIDQTVVYTVTPTSSANGCLGNTFDVSVVVHPKPVGAIAIAPAICSDLIVGYNLQTQNIDAMGNAVPSTFSWVAASNGNVGGESTAPQSGNIINDHLTNVTTGDEVVLYTVIPTSAANSCIGGSFTVSVTVHPKPVGINATAPPICSDASVNYDIQSQNINTLGNGINSTFSWLAAANANVSGQSTTAQSGSLIGDILVNVTNLDQTVIYTVTPSSTTDNCTGAPAFTVSVTVHPKPVGITASAPAICSDANVNYNLQTQNVNVLGNNLNATFSWIATANANVSGESTTAQAGNLITDNLVNVTSLDQTVLYAVTPTSTTNTCLGDVFTISVLVHPKPVGVAGAAPAICSDASVAYDLQVQNINALGNGVISTFSWVATSNGSVGGESTTPQSGGTINDVLTNVTNADQTVMYSVTPTSSANACLGAAFNISVVVHPKPVGVSTTAPPICSDASVNYDLQNSNINALGNNLASTFSWVAVANANVSGESTIAKSGSIINDILNNVTNSDEIVMYNVTPTGPDGCNGTVFSISVTVKPEPVGANDNKSICSDDGVAYNLQNNVSLLGNGLAGSSFTWIATADNPNVTGESLTLQNTPSITDVLDNVTANNEIVSYLVTPTGSNGCAGNAFTISITVEPEPVLSVTPTPVCSGLSTGLTLATSATSGPVANYNILSITIDGGLTAGSGNAPVPSNGQAANYLINDKFTNFGSGVPPLKVTYKVEPVSTLGCKGNAVDVVVVILPEPVVSSSLNAEVCSSKPSGITLVTNGTSVAATSFDITAVVDAGLVGTPTVGTGLVPAAIATDNFVNKNAVPLNVTYTVIPHGSDGCVGAAKVIVLKVDPEPVLFNPGFPAVCSSNATNSNPVNVVLGTDGTSVNAASYQLSNEQYSTDGGTTFSTTLPANFNPFGGANAVISTSGDINLVKNDMFTNTNATAVIVRYTINPTGPSPANCTGASLNYDVVVNPEPNMVPGTATVCSGDATGLVMAAAGGSAPITGYDLQSIFIADPRVTPAGTNVGLGHYAAGNFLAADMFTNVSNIPLHVIYTIVPDAGACKGAPKTVDLTVNPGATVASNLNKTVCTNDASGIVLATETSPLSALAGSYNILTVVIQAGLTQTAGNTGVRTGVTSNEIKNDKFQNPTNGPLTVTYTVQGVTGAPASCKGAPKDVILTVEPTITAAPVNNKADICSGDKTDIDLISPTVPTSGTITFNYTAVSSVGGLITGFSPSLNNLPANSKITDSLVNSSPNPATVKYSITAVANGAKSGLGCTGSPVVITVIVEPKPKLVATPSIQTVCEGAPASILLNSTTLPTTGTVEFKVVGVVAAGGMTLTSPAVPVTNYLKGDHIVDVWSNPDVVAHSVTYSLIPYVSGGIGCTGDTVVIVLNVNPLPNLSASAQAQICSNESINITLTSDVDNTINTWTAAVIAGSATGLSNGAGDLIFQTLKNTGTVPATVRYTITPKANGCSGPPITADVIINPTPDIVGVPSTSVAVCYGATLNIPLSSTVAGAGFRWTVDPNDLGVPLSGSGPLISQVLTNNTGAQDFLTYTITAFFPGTGVDTCFSAVKMMTVIAAPKDSIGFLNPDTWLCVGQRDFLQIALDGQAPFTFTYSTNGVVQPTVTNSGNFKSIQITPAMGTTVYKIESMKDAFGCVYGGPFNTVTYNVGTTDATFTVVGAVAACSPYQVSLQYQQKNGTEYDWQWGDGTPDSTYVATTDVTNQIIKHTYSNSSPSGTFSPKIVLQTDLPAPFPGCFKTSSQTISIYPTIIVNVYPDKSEICSGDQVRFTNQSFGVSSTGHHWFYEVHGTSTPIAGSDQTTQTVNYVMTNTSTSNPIIYDVIYQATNGHCPAPADTTQITVYRSVVASFSDGGGGPFFLSGGHVTVNFTNTSVPVDPAFSYAWDFGVDATPDTISGPGPFAVDYTSQGVKTVTLIATNIASGALSCSSQFQSDVTIELQPLIASYTAAPPAGCYPADITVTANTSTGDVMLWQLYDNNGSLVSVSNDNLPIFHITNPGKYTLLFQTSDSHVPSQAPVEAPVQTFEIYDKPFAAFEALPHVVYVPNTELTTINNSLGATSYSWDFGDQSPVVTDLAPKHTYKIEGSYDLTLTAENDHGGGIICRDTATQLILAKQGGVSKLPNAFTPNLNGPTGGTSASGSNYDVFLPSIKGVEEFNMQIYDRWGNLLFESNSINIGWDGYKDGKLMPAGVYVYKITLRLSDGQRTTQIGDVTMIR